MRDISVSKPVLEDLRNRLHCEDIFRWLESQAEQLATLGTNEGQTRTTLTRELFRARSIDSVRPQPSLSQHACIVPDDQGYQIHYSEGLPAERRRFALAHEL